MRHHLGLVPMLSEAALQVAERARVRGLSATREGPTPLSNGQAHQMVSWAPCGHSPSINGLLMRHEPYADSTKRIAELTCVVLPDRTEMSLGLAIRFMRTGALPLGWSAYGTAEPIDVTQGVVSLLGFS